MTDDLTVLRLDVDSEAMRTLLEAIPGIEPADLEPSVETDDDEGGESPPSAERTGPRVGETPPPGAGDPVTGAEGSDAGGRNRRRIALVGAIGVTALAVVGAVAAVLYRRRGREGGIDFDFDDRDGLPVGGGEETDGGDETETPAAEETATSERLSSKIDAAPILGMALLAVAAVVVRRLQAGG